MAELNPPFLLNNRTDHPASALRSAVGDLIARAGVCGVNDLKVTQRAAGANMSVDVAGGNAYVLGTLSSGQSHYHVESDSTPVNLAIAASSATQARIDIVIAEVLDSFYAGSTDLWRIRVVTGIAGSGSAPVLPDNALLLATINVAALASTVTTANIVDGRRRFSLRSAFVAVANQTERDALTLYDGLTVWRLDLHTSQVYNGTQWNTVYNGQADTGVITSTTGFVGQSGWSVSGVAYRRIGHMASLYIVMIRTGTAVAAGNITNQGVVQVPAILIPSWQNGVFNAGGSGGGVSAYMLASGVLTLTSTVGGIATGATQTFSGMYML